MHLKRNSFYRSESWILLYSLLSPTMIRKCADPVYSNDLGLQAWGSIEGYGVNKSWAQRFARDMQHWHHSKRGEHAWPGHLDGHRLSTDSLTVTCVEPGSLIFVLSECGNMCFAPAIIGEKFGYVLNSGNRLSGNCLTLVGLQDSPAEP